LAGKGTANPIGAFWSAAMMLDHLGETKASFRLLAAIEQVTGAGTLTPDLGGGATTHEVTAAVCEAIT
jgi:tartrate dehydrogenase/decarboxylase/D-malate dehydrogenase